jgi:hypothetical protein
MPAMLVAALAVLLSPAPAATSLDATAAARFAALALDCVGREYPNKIAHVLSGEEDVRPPHVLTPAFYGCYDWHSAVHGHWLLARLARTFPAAPLAAPARAALARSLTPANVAGEVAYIQGKGRTSFERPYGLAWLLQLAAELRDWNDADARAWSAALAPLEAEAALRFEQWLPKLTRPIRIGEHDQTAFSFGLILDWAATSDRTSTRDIVKSRAREFYLADRDCPMSYEPSGQDFLFPLPGRGGSRAPAPASRPVRGLALDVPAHAHSAHRPRLAHARGGHRSERSQARPPGWAQPLPRLDARGNRLRPPRFRSAAGRRERAGPSAPGRRPRLRDRRPLRRRALAGDVRGVPRDRARAAPA